MARKEKPVDPAGGPLAEFARDLRALRAAAGNKPYRALAKRAGYSASTLSVAASGAILPSLEVTLAYVQSCGGDPEAWRARWHQLAQQLLQAINDAPPAQETGTQASLSVDRSRLGLYTTIDDDARARQPRRSMRALIATAIAMIIALLLSMLGLGFWLGAGAGAGAAAPPVASSGYVSVPPTQGPSNTVNALETGAIPATAPSCGTGGAPPAQTSTLPASLPGDVQHLPAEFGSGGLAGGPLMPATLGSMLAGAPAVAAVAGSLTDVTGNGYVDPTLTDNGGEEFMDVTIGTPKPGQCWELLAYDTLAIAAGRGDVGDISTMKPGPHLASANVVLECGQVVLMTDICAWAGPGPTGGKPVFGLLRVLPGLEITTKLKDGAMLSFVDEVYAELTAKQ